MKTVTVAICTWNRPKLLDRTLAAMAALEIPLGVDWEVIVVNNNCTDDTDAVLRAHASRIPLRRLFEPTPGKSHAANRLIDEVSGDLILWTDDDVLVDRRWMAEYVEAACVHPKASFFGGTVDPLFEATPPAWIERHLAILGDIYAVRQLGHVVRPLTRDEFPYGANMAIRREAHLAHRFEVDLGPSGNDQVRGEEVVLFDRMRKAGLDGVWVGPARVRHFIPAERLNLDFVWGWYFGLGRTRCRQHRLGGEPPDFGSPRLGPYPRWMIRQSLESSVASWALSPWKGPRWLRAFERSAKLRGMMHEMARGAQPVLGAPR